MLVILKKSKKDHAKMIESPTKKAQPKEELKISKGKKNPEVDYQGPKMISTLKSKKGESMIQKV